MTADQRHIRCAVCAADEGPFERHHIALHANCEGATVPLCAPPRPCHDEQTERQRQAGLITKKPIKRGDELQTLYALTEGVTGIFTAHARHTGALDLATRNEQSRRATLRLLALIPDESGTLGPRPVANDRQRRRCGKRRQPDGAPAPIVTDALEAIAGILPALAVVIAETLPGSVELLPGLTADKLRGMLTPADARRLARNLAKLEACPRAGELAAAIEHDWSAARAAIQSLAAAALACDERETEHADFARLAETVRGFHTVAARWVELLSALTANARAAGLDSALERYLNRQADEGEGTLAA
jgi:hypothetical protein